MTIMHSKMLMSATSIYMYAVYVAKSSVAYDNAMDGHIHDSLTHIP